MRHSRRRGQAKDETKDVVAANKSEAEVEAITTRANDLLTELHEVLAEMGRRLVVLAGKGDDAPPQD